MKRFSSSLDPVQKLNAHHERAAALRLADAVQTAHRATTEIAAFHRAHDDSYRQNDWDQFESIYWGHQYRARLSQQLPALREKLSVAEEQLGLRRDEYHQAYRQNRTVQILIDKQKTAHQKKEANIAEDYTDDIGRYLLYKK